ncbi:hypothetical protein Anas_07997 [Armadillidium nasatum]|uniref:Smr domain-containing protein n=1 Tax=Armadillidium nasatum TaxID=96803 RepID=A0A5N5SZF8_9CRUS|nr:hypothetical protein Anas_07997 [Armadillidium nasatum]
MTYAEGRKMERIIIGAVLVALFFLFWYYYRYFTARRLSIFEQDGLETIDLHGKKVSEARYLADKFLHHQERQSLPAVQIITGRGLHSPDGIPVLKPVVRNMIRDRGLRYDEIAMGGAYKVYLGF